ncbi:hypothetical protein AB0M20_15670 [Actinoplanes sp. NPDC051633]
MPATMPATAPPPAGSSAWATYARTIPAGVHPSAFRMPIRRVAAPTVPAA